MGYFLLGCVVCGALSSWMLVSWCASGAAFAVRGVIFLLTFIYSQSFWLLYVLTGGELSVLPVWLSAIGAFSAPWLALSVFAFACLGLLSLVHVIPAAFMVRRLCGLAAAACCFIFLLYGFYNAANPAVRVYDIETRHISAPMDIAVVSDLHLGSAGMSSAKLNKVVMMVQSLKPRMILIPGDILDGPARPLDDASLMEPLRKLKAPLGTFAVLGNHDMYGGISGLIADRMKELGIKVLVDQKTDADGENISIIGRSDLSHGYAERPPLTELMKGVRKGALTIVLDHTPRYFSDSVRAGADLQVSGHTHNGQYFPVNLIVKFIYKKPWGVLKEDGSTLMTSCGVGTWGAPVRTGSVSEIALLRLLPMQ